MFDFNNEINTFWEEKVRLSTSLKKKLFDHRKANRDRLITRLPDIIEGVKISETSFKPQGSMAMQTIIQTRFDDEEYDIDDGIILDKEDLKDSNGRFLSTEKVRNTVLEALKDIRFVKQPKLYTNCVRVFYAEEDAEKHHVDFPIYRKSEDEDDIKQELANQNGWIESNPTQVNSWFENEISSRNKAIDSKGTQLRKLIQLLKRFARSRKDWDLPNGMKLTMLATECQKEYYKRLDEAFKYLLLSLNKRLNESKVIRNLAHPNKPAITKTNNDENVSSLQEKIIEAIRKLNELDFDSCNYSKAKSVWDWIFKSDGFFDDYSQEKDNLDDNEGFTNKTPSEAVDHKGGGRFG